MKKVIYGAGEYGKDLFDIMEKAGEKIEFFVQTDVKGERQVNGIPVISYEELKRKNEEYIVYIAIDNAKVIEDIKYVFKSDGYDMHKILNMQNFLKQNSLKQKECLLCKRTFGKFLPFGIKNEFFTEKKIIGGGYRENACCPNCGSIDRNRWVYWVLNKFTDIFINQNRIVHFAPERKLREIFEQNLKSDYYPVDLQPMMNGKKVHIVDVTHIPFTDSFADYIIINHVLEHIPNDRAAVEEMSRILKPNGKIIMSFPISTEKTTLEDSTIVTEEERERYYGQNDHVRLYGMDFKERLESYGLNVNVYTPNAYMSREEIEHYGLIQDDMVMICSVKNDEGMI